MDKLKLQKRARIFFLTIIGISLVGTLLFSPALVLAKGNNEAIKANAVFEKLKIIPSYTVKSNFDFSAPENISGIGAFNAFSKASSGKVNYSVEVDSPSTDLRKKPLMNQLLTSFLNTGGFTYHFRRLGGCVINFARKNFRSELNRYLDDLPYIIKNLKPTNISVHLGWGAEDVDYGAVDGHDVASSAPLADDILLKRISSNLLYLKKTLEKAGYNRPILVETLDYYESDAKGAYSHITDPKFIHKVIDTVNARKINVKLLVDTGHLLISAKNGGLYKPEDFMLYVKDIVNEKTIGLIDEVHIVVPVLKNEKTRDRYVDIHSPLTSSGAPAQEVKTILKYIFDLRSRLGISHPIIVNFETGIRNAGKELRFLSKIL